MELLAQTEGDCSDRVRVASTADSVRMCLLPEVVDSRLRKGLEVVGSRLGKGPEVVDSRLGMGPEVEELVIDIGLFRQISERACCVELI